MEKSINEQQLIYKLKDMIYRINNSMDCYGMFSGISLKRGTHTFVTPSNSYRGGFDIVVDMDDVEQYADECSISDLESAKALVSHEIMHVLLRHFKKEYRQWNHEIYNIAADCEVNSYLNMGGSSLRAKQFGLPDFLGITDYYRLIKGQSDEQNKQEQMSIKINMPSMSSGSSNMQTSSSQAQNDAGSSSSSSDSSQPSDNSSSDGSKTKTKTVTIDLNNSSDNSEESKPTNESSDDTENKANGNNDQAGKDQSDDTDENNKSGSGDLKNEGNANTDDEEFESENVGESDDVGQNEASDQMKKKLQKSNNTNMEDKYSDEEAEKIDQLTDAYGIGLDSIQRAAQTASKAIERTLNKNNITGLDELMRKLERKEHTMSITPHSRKETYMKLNNRRKNGTIILPGKRLENDGIKKKFDTSLTVFIDMSGSTWEINETLMNVAYRFYKLGATIVYYDATILDIVKPHERFRLMESNGGTNIKDVLAEYLETGAKLDRAYVITDGHDDFRALNEVVPKYTIYLIERKKIRELYSDKNPSTSRYW